MSRRGGGLPMVPGWNRETNKQISAALGNSLGFRLNGGAIMREVRDIEGDPKEWTGRNVASKEEEVRERFTLTSSLIGGGLDTEEARNLQPKVLRAYGYFKEAVHESSFEQARERTMTLHYYLEDSTVEILEPEQANSGLPQGIFLKRGRLDLPNGGGPLQPRDLNIGNLVHVYGKVVLICAVDGFTRNYFSKNGVEVPENRKLPEPTTRIDARGVVEWAGKTMFPEKTFMEAKRGKTVHDSEGMRKFLQYDQDTLRFALIWDNRDHLFGDLLDYTMVYYLADDTISINQSRKANTGREDFPTLWAREKLLKDWRNCLAIHERQVGAKYGDGETYGWRDLIVGSTIDVFGRKMRITAADGKTREFYRAQGVDLPPNERLVGQTVQRPTLPTPPYTGYGDELTNANDNSWRKLVPTKPKKDYNKIIGLDGQVLRFTAKLESSNPDDERRDFVFSFFLHDDTLRVFEPPIHNSGIVGGKFLEKGKYKHESGTRYLQPSDITVGGTVKLNCFTFRILGADKFTLEYMSKRR